MDNFSASTILAVAIPFVVQQLKKISWIGTKFAPVAAFICGILGGLAVYGLGLLPDTSLLQAIMTGAAIGGTSTGLYDLTKKLIGN